MMMRILKLTAVLGLFSAVPASYAAPVLWGANGHEYNIVYQNYISWDNSRAAAQSLGAGWDLATITSIEEQNFITGLLGPANVYTLVEYYLGGLYVNNAWTWVTGETFSFGYWGTGEPNGNSVEPRLALDSRYRQGNWGWNDYTGAGSDFVRGFVAERSAAVPEPSTMGLLALGLAALGCRFRKRTF